jgi:hypothetical protein
MGLDSVLTLAIGRNGADGKPMSEQRWNSFQSEVRNAIIEVGTPVFAGTADNAIGSDGRNDGVQEDSYAIIAINVKEPRTLRAKVAGIIGKYEQGSACFSIDTAHEPVFSTKDGWRS